MKKQAGQWPNKLGWDVHTAHGTAEVRDLVTRLRCFVPLAPTREWHPDTQKWATIDRCRVLDLPLGTPPEDCVATCGLRGVTVEDWEPLPVIPFSKSAQGVLASAEF